MHFLAIFSLDEAAMAAPPIVPRGAVASTLKDLLNDPNVDFIEKVSTIYGASTQKNAPWGLARISNKLRGKDHTTFTYDESASEGTCTYVLDTGIEVDHPEFEGRARFVQYFVDNADLDANGHGTHIAGTIGSKTGSDGIAVNMSLSAASSPSINAAARYIVKSGYFLAVAAGNEDTDASHVSPRSNRPERYEPHSPIAVFLRCQARVRHTSTATPHVTGLAAYLLGLKDSKASELCNFIVTMSLKDVIKGIPEDTVNLLIQNGEAK
ncbi:serine protease precursor [Fusarium tjaetaba]|uniref:Serine protease n=1 Tax=Fusarium tjaetaba TaxID=1567544 RepID=A0A8H5SEE6_9HYPO|nr:serine protease precursor [Fusarium tjaetaba]KAF5649493.1 serine protease precursor [Fusarium tjaetaba]